MLAACMAVLVTVFGISLSAAYANHGGGTSCPMSGKAEGGGLEKMFFWKTHFCKVSTLKLQPFAFAPTNLLHTSPFSHQYYTYFLEKVTYPQLLTFASCFATHNY